MRAIRAASREEAEALAAKVDAEHGYPRCDRLAGVLIHVGGGQHVRDCECRDVRAPTRECLLATRAEALPVELADRTWAYPVREDQPKTTAALSKQERGRVVTITDAERVETKPGEGAPPRR